MALVPDLEEVSRSFQTIRDNVDRLQNLPPFDGGAAILEELRALGRRMDGRFDDIQARLEQVEGHVGGLRTEIGAERYNVVARAANSTAAKPENILLALRDISTNITIPNFPATAGDLQSITGREATRILTALGLDANGTASEKKQRARLAVGIMHPIDG